MEKKLSEKVSPENNLDRNWKTVFYVFSSLVMKYFLPSHFDSIIEKYF